MDRLEKLEKLLDILLARLEESQEALRKIYEWHANNKGTGNKDS